MPTYKVDPFTDSWSDPGRPGGRLMCEACDTGLGFVEADQRQSGMSADTVTALWPEMQEVIRRHENVCGTAKA